MLFYHAALLLWLSHFDSASRRFDQQLARIEFESDRLGGAPVGGCWLRTLYDCDGQVTTPCHH